MLDEMIQDGGVVLHWLPDGGKRSDDDGVHWPLPLRHFKVYGHAVRKTRSLQIDETTLFSPDLL